jgi:DNA-binding MarR family transcriptional regulator
MEEDTHPIDSVSLPALLRAARAVYADVVHRAHAQAGYDDVPGNGTYVIGAIARGHASLSRIITELGVSKQAAGQLVDTLVLRGYLDRAVDPEDRRRLTVTLTERGRAAAAVSREAIDRLEAELELCVGAPYLKHTRRTLGALIHAHTQPEPAEQSAQGQSGPS